MTISQVSKTGDISSDTVRYYEKKLVTIAYIKEPGNII